MMLAYESNFLPVGLRRTPPADLAMPKFLEWGYTKKQARTWCRIARELSLRGLAAGIEERCN